MKTLNFVILFALSIFLISNASAVVLSGLWSNNASSMTVNPGNAVSFTVDFGSMHNPVSITETLYNSNDQAVWTKSYSGLSSGYVADTIPAAYIPGGNYQLVVNGNDAKNYPDSDTLSLTVRSNNPPPVNQPPVVSPIPAQSVNENTPYSYAVVASDPNGNTLFYSLVTSPPSNWLSINSLTGLISGMAPNVTVNTPISVTVSVSDGINTTNQSYVLTVLNKGNPVPNPTLTIQFVYPTPLSGSNFYSSTIQTEVNATSTNQIYSINVSLYNSSGVLINSHLLSNLQEVDFTGLNPGTYHINAVITDVFGNTASTGNVYIGLLSNNPTPYIASNYNYSDVYSNYNPQPVKTQPQITVSPSSNQKGSNAYSLVLIIFEALLILILLGLILLVFARRKFQSEISMSGSKMPPAPAVPMNLYRPKPSDDSPLY